MEFFRRSWTQIQAQLTQLTASQRWLIGMSMIVMLLAGALLLLYASQGTTVRLPPVPADRQATSLARLKSAGIDAKLDAGSIVVPLAKQDQALAVLAQEDMLTGDTSAAFDQMLTRQNPWMSNAQNAQAFLLAKNKVLGQIIGKMRGVRSADVVVSVPEEKGFGRSAVRPSAAVNVTMQSSSPVDRRMVEAIAGLVSGAVAGMKPQDVVVIDAQLGRQFTVKSENDVAPGETLELVDQIEQYHRRKISELLAYIPGVIVAVNVQTDSVQRKQVEEFTYDSSEPVKSEFNREMERKDGSESGAPGVRSNTGADVEGANASGSHEKTNETRTEYGEKNLTRRTQAVEVGRNARQINVAVNVPRSYFVSLHKLSKPAPAAGAEAKPEDEPTDEVLKPIVDAHLIRIKTQVEPLVSINGQSGVVSGLVRVDVVPDAGAAYALAHPMAAQSAVTALASSAWVKPAALLGLAIMAIGIMFTMVRKAMVQPPLPTVEELAGVPLTLPSDDEMVGEAEEGDASMAGVELDEDELRHRKMAEQISDLVKSNPTEVAKLFNRWVRTDE
jgi:flagellar M-ring protein FliF